MRWTYKKIKDLIEGTEGKGCKLLTTEIEFNEEKIKQNEPSCDVKLEIQCGCEEKNIFNTSVYNFNSCNKRQCNKCSGIIIGEKQTLNFETIKNYIEMESNSGCILLSDKEEYKNYDSKLTIKCKCGNNFSVSYRGFKYGHPKQVCDRCGEKNRSLKQRKSIKTFIAEVYELVGEEYTVLGEYINNHTEILMRHNCVKCNNNEFLMRPTDFLQGIRCPKCRHEILSIKATLSHEEFKNKIYLQRKDEYTLLSKYTGSKKYIKVRHNSKLCGNYEYEVEAGSLLSGCSCPKCFNLKKKGELSSSWKGGITPLHNHLRSLISLWKIESLKSTNYKCLITGISESLEVHHLYSFSHILQETMNILNLPIRTNISEYSDKDLKSIENKCLELHYKHGLGVPLSKNIHALFHHEYGQDGNTTNEDFKEFKERYINGEFDLAQATV